MTTGSKKRILILCTGNAVRSQMAEGLLRHEAGEFFEVKSAGTTPSFVRPEAISVMRELGIDISQHRSKSVQEFDGQQFDCVITVCNNARQTCPVFFGAAETLHRNFDDPAGTIISTESRMAVYRRVRDEMQTFLKEFAHTHIV
jgi:arsenate reductase